MFGYKDGFVNLRISTNVCENKVIILKWYSKRYIRCETFMHTK